MSKKQQFILTSSIPDYILDTTAYVTGGGKKLPENYLNIDGKDVVYFLNQLRGGTAVVVPGIVASTPYPVGEDGCRNAIDVEPITNRKFKSKVTEQLKDKGILTFW
jgi:hypothetical protein